MGIVLAATFIGCAATEGAAALGSLRHPSARELVTGARGILGDDSIRRRCRLEVCERAAHGLAGVHATGARLTCGKGRVGASLEAAQLTADVGRETRAAILVALGDGEAWAAEAGVVYDAAAIEGLETAKLSSLVLRSRVRLSETVFVGGEVDRLRIWGEAMEGADATLLVGARPVSPVLITCAVAFARCGGAEPGLAITLNGDGRLGLSLGYERRTEALKGAVAVGWGKIRCDAGVLSHPVLGAETVITVSWGRQ